MNELRYPMIGRPSVIPVKRLVAPPPGRRLRRSLRRAIVISCSLMIAAGAASGAAGGEIIRLKHDQILIQTTPVDSMRAVFRSMPSQRNPLQLKRDARHKLPLSASVIRTPRTLKVLGVRVRFPLENPDDATTTGRGRFDLRDTTAFFDSSGHHFDSAPHDRSFFEAHLRSLGLYWNTVSNGLITLESTVYPVQPDSSYPLPETMSFYGREREGDSGVAFGLRRYVMDAARAASEHEASLRYADYDAVIFFHPGADRQSDIMQDSPGDLFTGFLQLDSTVHLRNGTDSLAEAIIMPETESQDGRIAVLNGVMAHEFGHALGLIDLYNTRSFLTQVGNFSLYDNNAADVGVTAEVGGYERTVFGALPVYPDAWTRAYLGFVSVTELSDSENVPVPAAELLGELVQPYSQVLKIPISSTEYYLIENRRVDIDGRGDAGLRWDSLAYVVRGPVDTITRFDNREYDFLLPDSRPYAVPGGLLIWQVDEGVADLDYVTSDDVPNNFLANTLQWDPNRRFIHLMEADGIVNFGGFYSSGTGTFRDYYFSPNNRELSATTNPPALSNTGGAAGVRIFNVSAPGNTMAFSVSTTGRLDGFPVFAGRTDGLAGAPSVTDMVKDGIGRWRYPGDGRPEIFAGFQNYIEGWHWDGTPLGTKSIPVVRRSFDTTLETLSIRIVAQGKPDDDEWIAPPIIADFDGDEGLAEMVAVTRNGNVYEWRAAAGADSLFPIILERTTSARPSCPPIALNRGAGVVYKSLILPLESRALDVISLVTGQTTRLTFPGTIRGIAGTSDSDAVVIWRSDSAGWSIGSLGESGQRHAALPADSLLPPVMGDLNHDGVYDAAVVDVSGRLWALETAEFTVLPGFPVDLEAAPSAPPVLADIDRDGYLDILVAAKGRIHAIAYTGAALPNYPVVVGPANAPDSASVSPAVSDFGNNGTLSLLTGGIRRALYGFNGDGTDLNGFPRPLGEALTAPAAAGINTKDHRSAVFARAGDGYLYAFEVPQPAATSNAVWPMAFRDCLHTSTVALSDLEPVTSYTRLFPVDSAFVYPNPARDKAIVRFWLGEPARVNIRIFDLAGNLVQEARDIEGVGGVFNQPWIWNCAEAASGVYFVRIEAVAITGGDSKAVMCKMSVVH